MSKEHEKIFSEVLKKLMVLNPKLVMVFGSYAKNNFSEVSDLDLLVVLNTDKVPENYDEKLEMKLKVRKAIRELNKKIAIDLLVYTTPEYIAFTKSESSFSKELQESGKIIYEKEN